MSLHFVTGSKKYNWFKEILRSLSCHSGCVVLFIDLHFGEISCHDLVRRRQCILIAVNEQDTNAVLARTL